MTLPIGAALPIEKTPTYEQLVECNKQYLLAVVREHPELSAMVPAWMLEDDPRQPDNDPVVEDAYPFVPLTSMEEAAHRAARRYGLTFRELIGTCRGKKYQTAREEFVRDCRQQLGKSYPEIGIFMSRRHHTSVLYYMQRYEARQEAA